MQDFIAHAIRTESPAFPLNEQKYPEAETNRLLHAAIGMVTEASEFIDAMKKHLFYRKPLDEVNLKEELGDVLWYVAIAMDALDTDFPTEMARVIKKLRTRFPDKFTDNGALFRDLEAERKTLEG